jgi:predicted nucleic acid-binding protein
MNGRVFVDTNVLVYCRDASEPKKHPLALNWIKMLWETGRGVISYQVLQEYYVT